MFKEFMNALIKNGFNPGLGLFKATPSHQIYPDPRAVAHCKCARPTFLVSHRRNSLFPLDPAPDAMAQFEFLGRMVGKCLYERIVVDLPFAGFFLNKVLGRNNYCTVPPPPPLS